MQVSTADLEQYKLEQDAGMGFLPLLIAAIPALANTGFQIANSIIGSQNQKKLDAKQEQLDSVRALQARESAPLLAEQQRLAQIEKINLYKTVGLIGGMTVGSFFAYKIISKVME